MKKKLFRPLAKRKDDDSSVKSKPNTITVLAFVLLTLYSIIMIVLFIWTLLSSVKGDYDFNHSPFGVPEQWQFKNYVTALSKFSIPIKTATGPRNVYLPEMLLNSLIYSVGCSIVNTAVTCIVAYVTCKYTFRFSKVVYGIVIVTMILPIVGSLPSELQVAKSLGLYDHMFGLFVMKANFLGMNYLIFYSAFKNLPWDYAEAAFVDGASHFRVMTRVMIPMIKPVIMIVLTLSFIGFWNDYYVPMMFMPNHPTAAYGLYKYQFAAETEISTTPMKLAGCMIVFAPILVLFLVMKDKMIGNLTVGGLKG